MGSHSVDSNTQNATSAAAQAATQQQTANAKAAQTASQEQQSALFGTYDPVTNTYSGGTESQFLDPSRLNQPGLSDSYLSAYNAGSDVLANNAKKSVGTTMQNLNSRGMGKTPAGFAADQERRAYQDEAASQAGLYNTEASNQLTNNLAQYNNANALLANTEAQNQNSATSNLNGAGATNTSLYGTASQQVASPWSSVIGAAAGVGSSAITKYCWIAEAVYGVDDIRTHVVRAYLSGSFRDGLLGSLIMRVYGAVGKQVAWFVRRSKILRALFTPVFDKAFDSALAFEGIR